MLFGASAQTPMVAAYMKNVVCAGATDYGVLSVMPVAAFDPAKTRVVDYETRFAKADEHAAAGRYEVTFVNGIKAELTSTSSFGPPDLDLRPNHSDRWPQCLWEERRG